MSTQLAQLEVPQRVTSEITGLHALHMPEDDLLEFDVIVPGHSTSVARGIASAVVIATPFWALFAFALYLLI